MKIWTFLISIVFTLTSCGGGGGGSDESIGCSSIRSFHPRIAGGENCSSANSTVVRVGIEQVAGSATCSGTLITPQDVLTARHCVTLSGIVGATVSNDSEEGTAVSGVFDPLSDQAIVHLAAPMRSKTIGIFCRDLSLSDLIVGNTFDAYGYGYDENQKLGELKRGRFTVISENGFQFAATTSQDQTSFTCHGDSGGPAISSISYPTDAGTASTGPIVRGIVSLGTNNNCDLNGGVTQFVYPNCDFIAAYAPGALRFYQ